MTDEELIRRCDVLEILDNEGSLGRTRKLVEQLAAITTEAQAAEIERLQAKLAASEKYRDALIDAAVAEAVEKSAGVAAKQIHAYGWKASWHPSHVNGIVRDTLAAIRALIPKKSVKEARTSGGCVMTDAEMLKAQAAEIERLEVTVKRFAERHERHLVLGAEARVRVEKAEAKAEAKLENLIGGAETVLEAWDSGNEAPFREAIEELRADVAEAKGGKDAESDM